MRYVLATEARSSSNYLVTTPCSIFVLFHCSALSERTAIFVFKDPTHESERYLGSHIFFSGV